MRYLLGITSLGLVATFAAAQSGPSAQSQSILVQGMYKAALQNNHKSPPNGDGKFRFKPDGTFQFCAKKAPNSPVTHGTYKVGGSEVILMPAAEKANWPSAWESPAKLHLDQDGNLGMGDIVFTSNLIGKTFIPGKYLCQGSPGLHYYFDHNGGYHYTGLGDSMGDYWVVHEPDESGTDKSYLVLAILRVGGALTYYHQKLALEGDGTAFTIDNKYHYKLSTPAIPGTKPAK